MSTVLQHAAYSNHLLYNKPPAPAGHEVLTSFLCVDLLQPCESLGLRQWTGFGRLIGQFANGIEQSISLNGKQKTLVQ